MTRSLEKALCRTPTPDKKPTQIDRWKFDAVRRAILAVLPKNGEGVLFTDLPKLVEAELEPEELDDLGSIMWYTTTVKLELEVRGEIHRVKGVSPQRLLLK